jgi:hypothetical protein
VKPLGKDKLGALDPDKRLVQETDEILATTARLIDELQALIDNAKKLGVRHTALMAKVQKRPK